MQANTSYVFRVYTDIIVQVKLFARLTNGTVTIFLLFLYVVLSLLVCFLLQVLFFVTYSIKYDDMDMLCSVSMKLLSFRNRFLDSRYHVYRHR